MKPTDQPRSDQSIQHELRQLFDSAAAKSLAVIDEIDAEAEMARFLHAVKANPQQREFVVDLMLDSFSESFYMRNAPTDLIMFCMHDLRWPEIRDFVKIQKAEDIKKHGVGCCGVWQDLLDAFQDDWEAAKYFKEFNAEAEK